MPRYPSGQPIRLTTTVKDVNDALADPGALTLRLYGPTGALAQTYSSPTRTDTGLYYQDVPAADLATAGRYRFEWTATGSNAGVRSDVFDVDDTATGAPIVALADVKAHLNKTTTDDDAELLAMIAAAGRVVEWKIGPVAPRTCIDIIRRPGWKIRLPRYPIISLTSSTAVVDGVTPDDPADLDFDADTGIVWRSDGAPMVGGQRMVYVAGRTVVTANVVEAANAIIEHLWETQRGGSSSPARVFGAEEVTVVPGMGFSVPNYALELLAPDALGSFLA